MDVIERRTEEAILRIGGMRGGVVRAIVFAGGIGAFVKTYRVWKEEGAWPAWQGAGWFLLTFMLVCLSIPWSAATFAGGTS